jgi:hypothetical protein
MGNRMPFTHRAAFPRHMASVGPGAMSSGRTQGLTWDAVSRRTLLSGLAGPAAGASVPFGTAVAGVASDGAAKRVALRQGTNLAARLSPDGRLIAMDLVGVLRVVPRIAPDTCADLCILGGDPLSDITQAANVRQVMTNGRVYGVDDLLAPFATPVPVTPQSRLLAPVPDHPSDQRYWWHDPHCVEDSLRSCCAGG